MKNALGIEIPEYIEGLGELKPFQGVWESIIGDEIPSTNIVRTLKARKAHTSKLCRNLEEAIKLRNLAEAAGFKYSSIRSIKMYQNMAKINTNNTTRSSNENDNQNDNKNEYENENEFGKITVELLSTERLNIPLGYNGELIVNDEYLDHITKIANQVIIIFLQGKR